MRNMLQLWTPVEATLSLTSAHLRERFNNSFKSRLSKNLVRYVCIQRMARGSCEDAGPALFGLTPLPFPTLQRLPGLHFQLLKICKWSQDT